MILLKNKKVILILAVSFLIFPNIGGVSEAASLDSSNEIIAECERLGHTNIHQYLPANSNDKRNYKNESFTDWSANFSGIDTQMIKKEISLIQKVYRDVQRQVNSLLS